MRSLLIILFIFCISPAISQVKVDAKPTGKHARAINQAKSAKQTAKQRKAQLERLQEQAKAREVYKEKYDSIKQLRLDSIHLDSIKIKPFSKEDSLAISEEVFEQTNIPAEYRKLILEPIIIQPEISKEDADSIALAEATAVLEEQAKKFMPDELGGVEDPLSQFKNPAAGLDPTSTPTRPNPNIVNPEEAQELFKQIDPEQFQEVQADLQKLKQKYSKLPDTRFPEKGVKRNSLEQVPFKKRLYFGGNFSIQSTDPFIIDSNLQLGYWINKKWVGGVGIILREQFNDQDTTSTLTGDGYGYSLFTRYDIPKGFFGWAEVERQINQSFFNSENTITARWQSAYLLGIGREFKVGFVQMTSMILYDFNYQNNDLNARPLVFKFGVRFDKKDKSIPSNSK
ncbi:hypothetical protein [Ekhidna sp.]|uniref:hypothetical protein n=1 Tax=Ekhidna sp. TaxID=2608089 RepID=UPI003B50DBD0